MFFCHHLTKNREGRCFTSSSLGQPTQDFNNQKE